MLLGGRSVDFFLEMGVDVDDAEETWCLVARLDTLGEVLFRVDFLDGPAGGLGLCASVGTGKTPILSLWFPAPAAPAPATLYRCDGADLEFQL